jgi:putative aldouronate transport system substrate-binding protein
LKNAPQHLVGGPNDGAVLVNQDTLKSEIYANKDYSKTYYKQLNELYKKGIISPETFTQNYDQYLSKISSGRVLGMYDQGWNFLDGQNVLIDENRLERTYVPLGITYDGYEQWYKESLLFVGGNGIGISVNAKDVDGILSYMDALLDEDIQKALTWGIENEDYYIENGRMLRNQQQRDDAANPTWVVNNIGGQHWYNFPKMEGQFLDGNATSPTDQKEALLESQRDYDKNFLSQYDFVSSSDFLTRTRKNPDYYPVWGFTIEDGTDAKNSEHRISELQERYLPRIIMSEDFESSWIEYIAEFEKIDYVAYEKEVDKQIAQRMKN